MLISFPHMGKMHLALEKTCQVLNIPYIVPSLPGPETLKLGQELSPEGSCLPFCLVLGNMREALDKGADTILMLGGQGPCRFGYFIYLAVHLLKDAGYEFEPLIIDKGLHLENYRKLKYNSNITVPALIKAFHLGWELLACEEMLSRIEREYSPRVQDLSSFNDYIAEARTKLGYVSTAQDIVEIRRLITEYMQNLKTHPLEEFLKVGLLGDIYTLLEPYVNQRIEEYLLKRSIIVYKEMSVTSWLPNIVLPWRTASYRKKLLQKANPYLSSFVGGFGLETVANAQMMRNITADGIIQLFPLGCMPEIVAHSALDKMSSKEKIPVLCVTLDQHHSQTGFETRLEAFLDILSSRQQKEQPVTA